MTQSHDHPLLHTKCVFCGEHIEPTYTAPGEPLDAYKTCWRGAGKISLGFGYGSKLDTCYFYGLIHDDCAKGFIEGAAAEFVSGGAMGTPSTMKNVAEVISDDD